MSAPLRGPRLLPQAVEAWSSKLARGCAWLGIAVFAFTHWISAAEHDTGSSVLYWSCAVAAVVLPLAGPALTEFLSRWLRHRRSAEVWAIGLQLLPLILWQVVSPAHWLLLVLTVLQGNLLARARRLDFEAWMIGLAPVQVLVAMSAAPDPLWLLLLPTSVVLSSSALLLLSLRYHYERLQARAAAPFMREWASSPPTEVDTHQQIRKRLRSALPVGLGLLLLISISYPTLVALPRPSFNPRQAAFSRSDAGARNQAAEREDATGGANSANETFPGDIRPGGSLGALSYETVITFTARPAQVPQLTAGDVGPIYLRALCLDTFTETGLRSTPSREDWTVLDGDDGRRDGWSTLAASPAEARWHLNVQQNALRLRGSSETLIFAAQPALSIRLDELQEDPDRFMALPPRMEVAEFSYELIVGVDRAPVESLAAARAIHPDARFVQLPQASEDLRWLGDRARRLTSGASNDWERVQGVLDHFQEDFDYSTETSDLPGVRGITNFMRRERGHCTSFAAASTLLLRLQGIPARVITGFLATDYNAEAQRYEVTRANGHAWIEVHFEGLGWQRFEPTPTSQRMQALLELAAGGEEGLRAWAEYLWSDAKAWASSGADEAYLGQLMETLAEGPAAAWVSTKAHPGFATLLALVVVMTFLRRPLRRQLVKVGQLESSANLSLQQELLAALAARGHRKAPGKTLREFVDALPRDSQSGLDRDLLRDELIEVVDGLNRARFGGHPLESELIQRAQVAIRGLRDRLDEDAGAEAGQIEPS